MVEGAGDIEDGSQEHYIPEQQVTTLTFTSWLKCTCIKLLKLYFTPVTKAALMMVHCVPILDRSHLYVYGDHVCYSYWQIGIIIILLPGILLFPICFELTLRLLKDKQILSWQFVLAAGCPYYSLFLYMWKRTRGKRNGEEATLSDEEEALRETILETEESLFKQV